MASALRIRSAAVGSVFPHRKMGRRKRPFRVAAFRGNASNGGYCGLAYVNSNNGVGNANSNYGGRLYFANIKKRPLRLPAPYIGLPV